jgi:hypothetical protein
LDRSQPEKNPFLQKKALAARIRKWHNHAIADL